MTTQRRRQPQTRRISDQWIQYVRGTVTESAAATYTEVTVNLPVVVAEGFVIEAHTIEFEVPGLTAADLTAQDDEVLQEVQLVKSPQTTIITIDDPDLIQGFRIEYQTIDIQTAEKSPVLAHQLHGNLIWQYPEPLLLPFHQIHFGARTLLGSVAGTYAFRIGYKTVRLTTRQLPELIQAVS